jgi:hypothetical protein
MAFSPICEKIAPGVRRDQGSRADGSTEQPCGLSALSQITLKMFGPRYGVPTQAARDAEDASGISDFICRRIRTNQREQATRSDRALNVADSPQSRSEEQRY